LNPKNLGLTGGILWGLTIFVLTLMSVNGGGYAGAFLAAVASIYPGYTITTLGSVIGLVWGFVDAFIALFIFAWLYNWLGKRDQKTKK